MITLLAIGFYLAMGAALGVTIDGDQMKKPVPYGHAPSYFSLRTIRVATYFVFIFFWLPLVAHSVCRALAKDFRSGDTKQKGESPHGS